MAEEVPAINELEEAKSVEKSEEHHSLSEEETQAINNPGQEIPVGDYTFKPKRIDFWHMVFEKFYSKVLIFEDGKIQTVNKKISVATKRIVIPHVVFCLAAIGCLVLSNLLALTGVHNATNRDDTGIYILVFICVLFAFLCASVFAFLSTFVTSFLVACAFTLVALVSFIVCTFKYNAYWECSILCYIFLMAAVLV